MLGTLDSFGHRSSIPGCLTGRWRHLQRSKHLFAKVIAINLFRPRPRRICQSGNAFRDKSFAPFAPADIYQRTKLEGELLARKLAAANGLALSVVRPTAIYGLGDMRLLKLFRLAVKKITPVIGIGRIFYHMVYIDDLVQGFLLASEQPAAVGEVFIIGGDENLLLDDLLSTIARITGSPDRKIHIPARPFQLAGSLCEKICIPLGIEPPI